jgi:hypothetical protein
MNYSLSILSALFLFAVTADAAPKYRDALSSARTIRKSEIKLAKTIAKLSSADREKLKKALGSLGLDSDKDGVSDIFERGRGSEVCDADSDDDGVDDREDGFENDDNRLAEVEARGRITSFNESILVVGSKSFTVTATTAFRKGVSSQADLVAGACIKVEGYTTTSNVTIAKKIEEDFRCPALDDDSRNDDNSSDDDSGKGDDD